MYSGMAIGYPKLQAQWEQQAAQSKVWMLGSKLEGLGCVCVCDGVCRWSACERE